MKNNCDSSVTESFGLMFRFLRPFQCINGKDYLCVRQVKRIVPRLSLKRILNDKN